MLDAALQKLADSQAHRDGLDEAARKVTLTQDRLATLRAEQALPVREQHEQGRSLAGAPGGLHGFGFSGVSDAANVLKETCRWI